MKLYYTSGVCSLAVRIIIHELELPCDYEAVNLKTKQTEMGKNFLEINPKGSVPALAIDKHGLLTENAVILQYLADHYQANDLLPPLGDMRRYRALEWLNFVSTDLHRYCSPLFWSKFSDEVKENIFKPIFHSKLKLVEQALQAQKFLMGEQFTLADSYLFVILVWMAKLKMDMTQYPNLLRYFNQLKQRPAVQQALIEEDLTNLSF